jgi:U3 small nucleolar RNA-associated protein 6
MSSSLSREARGLEAARAFYKRFLQLPGPGRKLFHAAIDMEVADQNTASTSPKLPSMPSGEAHHMHQLFEAAVSAYGTIDCEIWLKYAAYSSSYGKGSGPIYWRATKELSDPEPFIEAYHRNLQRHV